MHYGYIMRSRFRLQNWLMLLPASKGIMWLIWVSAFPPTQMVIILTNILSIILTPFELEHHSHTCTHLICLYMISLCHATSQLNWQSIGFPLCLSCVTSCDLLRPYIMQGNWLLGSSSSALAGARSSSIIFTYMCKSHRGHYIFST